MRAKLVYLITYLFCMLNFQPILAEEIEHSQMPNLPSDGISCLECIYISYGPARLLEVLEGDADGEVSERYRITVIRSEIYHSLALENIMRDDRARPRRFASGTWFYNNLDITTSLGKSPNASVEFVEWVSPSSFVIAVGGEDYHMTIGESHKLQVINQGASE